MASFLVSVDYIYKPILLLDNIFIERETFILPHKSQIPLTGSALYLMKNKPSKDGNGNRFCKQLGNV